MPNGTTPTARSSRGASKATSTAPPTRRWPATLAAAWPRHWPRSASSTGDRVATLAWNGYRHMELYFGISGSGAVMHTVNPRLHPDQITYIADHAEDQMMFFDMTFLPLIQAVARRARRPSGTGWP
jgi:acyl-CoA synthetase (AMP-forming)/AMP-acid ligase II